MNSELLRPSAWSLSNGIHSIDLECISMAQSASSLALLCHIPNLFTLTAQGGLPRSYHTGPGPRLWKDMALLLCMFSLKM